MKTQLNCTHISTAFIPLQFELAILADRARAVGDALEAILALERTSWVGRTVNRASEQLQQEPESTTL